MVLIIVYYAQGVIYPVGTFISRVSLLLLLFVSAIYFVVFLLSRVYAPSFVKAWTALLIVNSVYFLLEGDLAYVGAFQSILLNMLPFYAFYYFSQQGVLSRNHLIVFFVVLLPIVIIRFVTSSIEMQDLINKEEVVDNTVYLFLGLLPYVFLFRRTSFSIAAILVIWIFLVQSGKRAAFIAGAITMLVLFYFQFKSMSSQKRQLGKRLFWVVSLVCVIVWGFNRFLENEFLVHRLQLMLQGDTAGRDKLYKEVFTTWYESNSVVQYLFGRGFQTSEKVTSSGSHNDWLDILASFGLVGFLVYFILFTAGFMQLFEKGWVNYKKAGFVCLILIALLASLTSRWYWSSFAYSQMLLLPYLLASRNRVD